MTSPIFDLRRAGQRFLTTAPGLTSRHLFSFGEHYDPDNIGHGRLMVSNDELVSAGAGFADHPHRDAEIVTWVLSGSLVHTDSSGVTGIVHPGLAQRMSAGRGIVHAERNDAFRLDPDRPAVPVHFVQMWVRPDDSGGDPSYGQREVDLAGLRDGWTPVASGRDRDAAVTLGAQGATLWVTVLDPGVSRQLPAAPYVHLYVARGVVEVETLGPLAAGDSLRVTGAATLAVTGREQAEVLAWELDA